MNATKKSPRKQAPRTVPVSSTTGCTPGTRTLQQETYLLRALGLTERPKYPVAGEMYRMDFLDFREHVSNKLPLYDGRAVTSLGSFRKPRNFKLVCALHPACPFLLHAKQQVYADGLAYQEIKEVVKHTCSVQSHANTSLCSAAFLGYFLREEDHLLTAQYSRSQGVDTSVQAGKKFGIDLSSMPRRQMFYKATKAKTKQDGGSASSEFHLPSPIIVTQVPVYNLEPYAPTISNLPSSMETQSEPANAELATVSAVVAEVTTGGTTGTRTPQQETALLRALGLTERPKYPAAGEAYRLDSSEFRQHFCNKVPLYDGRAVTTLGSFRKPRNYKLVCALHPACPFLLHAKQEVYADGLAYQEIKAFVNHTCSVESHADASLCSATFMEYFLREEENLLPANFATSQGVTTCAQAEEKFGIDLSSMARQQILNKAVMEAKTKQDGGSALSASHLPSPIVVSQIPAHNPEPSAPTISNLLPSMETQSDSTTAELATASTESLVPLVHATAVAETTQPKPPEGKSDQSTHHQEKRKAEDEIVMDSNEAEKKLKLLDGTQATKAQTNSDPAPQSTSTPTSSANDPPVNPNQKI
jgi:hypothetical protein